MSFLLRQIGKLYTLQQDKEADSIFFEGASFGGVQHMQEK